MKSIFLLVTAFILFGHSKLKAQENHISLTIGSSINLKQGWNQGLENKINIRGRYLHHRNLLLIGTGLNYSNYKSTYYSNPESINISELSPFLLLGLNFKKNKLAISPT